MRKARKKLAFLHAPGCGRQTRRNTRGRRETRHGSWRKGTRKAERREDEE